jgi:hypothetical protein
LSRSIWGSRRSFGLPARPKWSLSPTANHRNPVNYPFQKHPAIITLMGRNDGG